MIALGGTTDGVNHAIRSTSLDRDRVNLTLSRSKVWNEPGSAILPLLMTDAVPTGTVSSEKGAWLATSRTGQTISALVSAEMRADLMLGACYNDTRVEVSAA